MRIGKLEKGVNGNIEGFRQLVEVALRSQDGGGQGDTSKVHVHVRVAVQIGEGAAGGRLSFFSRLGQPAHVCSPSSMSASIGTRRQGSWVRKSFEWALVYLPFSKPFIPPSVLSPAQI